MIGVPRIVTPQVALVDGLYRCNGIGETVYAERGEILPFCSRERCGGTKWELRAEDQISPGDMLTVLVGQPGPDFAAIAMGEIPEVGATLNLRSPAKVSTKFAGLYRIVDVDMMQWQGKDEIRIRVERVGPFDETGPIHDMILLTLF